MTNGNLPHLSPDAAAAARECAAFVLDRLREAVAQRGRATLAVSGGRTPGLLFDEMSKADFPWKQLHLFFVDERAVPPTDDQSNFLLANEHLIGASGIPQQNVHRVEGEKGSAEAAQRYVAQIQNVFALREEELPVFDVIQLGMGPDGHTASLFPGEPLIADRKGIAAAVVSPDKAPRDRVTLLPGVLLGARDVVYLLDGADKQQALEAVLTGDPDPMRYPSQLLALSGKRIDWFLAGLRWPLA